ncbi:MAG: hypothetical protein ACE5HV_09935 [Acidobacteriota bacterium]
MSGWRAVGAMATALVALVAVARCTNGAQGGRLRYVTTARQLGPVAYRDPLGVPSPDGRWLATQVGLHLRLEPLAGGPVGELGKGQRRRLHLAWRPGSRTLVAREANRERTWFDWSEYDTVRGTRSRLWDERQALVPPHGEAADRGDLLELQFAADGRVAGLVARDGGRQLWIFDDTGAVFETVAEPGRLSDIAWKPDGGVACVDADTDVLAAADSTGPKLHVVLDWFEELKQRVPVER